MLWAFSDLDSMSFQKARKISYVYESKTWEETDIEVCIESEPFAKGAMRNAYKMLLKVSDSAPSDWVCLPSHLFASTIINDVRWPRIISPK